MGRSLVLLLAFITTGVAIAACSASQPNNTPSPTTSGPTPTPPPPGAANCTNGDFAQLSGGPGVDVFQGVETNTTGSWTATLTTGAQGTVTQLTIQNANIQGAVNSEWTFTFSTAELTPPTLVSGDYSTVQGAGGTTTGLAGLSVTADGQACTTISGSFRIGTIATDSNGLYLFQATFSQECNDSPSDVLTGCVNYAF